MEKKILIINGPNLNLLGKREAIHYGNTTFKGLKKECENYAKKIGVKIEFKQTNIAGAYTHTSIALRDALLGVSIPYVEVHLSNIYSREEFRHKSLISNAVKGIICGFGTKGYLMAIDGLINLIEKK